jgi:hypothetical protein
MDTASEGTGRWTVPPRGIGASRQNAHQSLETALVDMAGLVVAVSTASAVVHSVISAFYRPTNWRRRGTRLDGERDRLVPLFLRRGSRSPVDPKTAPSAVGALLRLGQHLAVDGLAAPILDSDDRPRALR